MIAHAFVGRVLGQALNRIAGPWRSGRIASPLAGMLRAILLLTLCLPTHWALAADYRALTEFTPSDVYAEAGRIEREMGLLRDHLGISGRPEVKPVQAELKPRHSWALTYEILIKINRFRTKIGLPEITVHSLAPVLDLDPGLVFEQTQRILAETRILRARLGIAGDTSAEEKVGGKRPVDVVNRLRQISAAWDQLNGEEPSPRMLFAEGMRIYQDIGYLIGALGQEDRAFPREKPEAGVAETQAALRELIDEIQRLQRAASIPSVDFEPLIGAEKANTAGLMTLAGMALAELQTLKAQRGLNHSLTPPADYHAEKSLGDVVQLLRWCTRRLHTIGHL